MNSQPIPLSAKQFLHDQLAAIRDAFMQVYPSHVLIISSYIREDDIFLTDLVTTKYDFLDACRATAVGTQRLVNTPEQNDLGDEQLSS